MNRPLHEWFRLKNERVFAVGDRVEWDGKRTGTVVALLGEDNLSVEWDDSALGRTMAPAWSKRLEIVEDTTVGTVSDWDEPTCPGWIDQTAVDLV